MDFSSQLKINRIDDEQKKADEESSFTEPVG